MTPDHNIGQTSTDDETPDPEQQANYRRALLELPAHLQTSITTPPLSPATDPTTTDSDPPKPPPPDPLSPTDPDTTSPSPSTPPTPPPDVWSIRPYPLITPTPDQIPRWQQLNNDPTQLDIHSMACDPPPDFNAGTLNVGGSLRDRITDITYLFAATNMDYLGLQDTRQTKREGQTIAATIRELLPPGTLVLQAPITKTRPSNPAPIGGQLIIISKRWSHHANHWYADPTGRGLLT